MGQAIFGTDISRTPRQQQQDFVTPQQGHNKHESRLATNALILRYLLVENMRQLALM